MRWIFVLLFAAPLVADLVFRLRGSALMLMSALGLIFAGERLFSDDAMRWVFSGTGFAVLVFAVALRWRAYQTSEGSRRQALWSSIQLYGLITFGLALYALSTDAVVTQLKLSVEAASRWQAVLSALWPIFVVSGALTTALLDRALWAHPVALPLGATRRIVASGLTAAFGIALVFPVNFVANNHKWEWETAHFKVTAPGEGTLGLARALTEPVEVFLVFPPGSDTLERVRPYFEQVQSSSSGALSVRVVDPAVDVALAEELAAKSDGLVVFRQGETKETLKLDPKLDKARRDLKKLDGEVQKRLWKVGRGPRTAYLYVGHGEASASEKDDPFRKISTIKRYLETLNLKVKDFGLTEGSTEAVPDDADLVILAAPKQELLPEEVSTLQRYLDQGGRALIFVEPGGERLAPVLSPLGISAGEHTIADARYMLSQQRGNVDRGFILTDKIGSHASIKELAKTKGIAFVFPEATPLQAKSDSLPAPISLVKSMEGSWADIDRNREPAPLEPKGPFDIGFAVSGPSKAADGREFRAVVFGDVSFASDPVLAARSPLAMANRQLVADVVLWLIGEDATSTETNSEEDQKIQHTRDEDIAWFWGTILVVPLIVLLAGAATTLRRGRA